MLFGEWGNGTPLPCPQWSNSDCNVGTLGGSAVISITNAAVNQGGADPLNSLTRQTQTQTALMGVAFSFSAAVTAGRLTIVDSVAGTILDLDLGTAAGWWQLQFPMPRKSPINSTITITLATGGGSGVPKLNVLGRIDVTQN